MQQSTGLRHFEGVTLDGCAVRRCYLAYAIANDQYLGWAPAGVPHGETEPVARFWSDIYFGLLSDVVCPEDRCPRCGGDHDRIDRREPCPRPADLRPSSLVDFPPEGWDTELDS